MSNTVTQPGVICKFTEGCFISFSRHLPALIGCRPSVVPSSKAASSGKRYKLRGKEPCWCSWNREAAAVPQPGTGPALAAVLLHCRSCCNHQTRSRGGDAQRHLGTAAGKPCDIRASLVRPFPKGALVLSGCSSPSLQLHTHTNVPPHVLTAYSSSSKSQLEHIRFVFCTPVYLPLLHKHCLPALLLIPPFSAMLSLPKGQTDASLLLFLFILVTCKSCKKPVSIL